MSDITFNTGVIYLDSTDGELHPIGEVEEMNFYEPVKDGAGVPIHETLTSSEATFTLTLTPEKVKAFIEQLLNVRERVLDLVCDKGHSRIAYLARHARKHRTRKKNLFRAYRILQREGCQWLKS